MAIYKSPGVYFTEYTQSIGSTAFGYNRTAIVGVAQSYINVSNLELVKSAAASESAEDIDSILLPSGLAASAGYVPSVGDYVKLVNGAYKKVTSTEEDALEVVADTDTPSASQIKLSAVTPVTPKQDIMQVTGVGSIPGFNDYVLGTDYTLDEQNTTITWIGSHKPLVNSTFYVSYKLNKSEERGDYEPKLMFNQTQIKEQYGPEYLNGVIQPLTLGADLVLEGQTLLGGGVYCVQVTEDSEAAYKAAIDKLDKINVQTVICLKQDSLTLRNYLIQKNAEMSSNLYKKFRTTFIVPNSDDLTQDQIVAQREGLDNERVTYFANKKVTIQLTDDESQEITPVALSAIYACCNLSGIEGNPEYSFSEPMLRKTLSSRITLEGNQQFDPSERNYLCSNFLSAFDFNENTNLVLVFDIYTCCDDNVITETRSVRRVVDLLMTDLDRQLDVYIGQKTQASVASSAQVRVQSILANYVSAEEIKDYRNVQSSYDPNNPKQLNISMDIVPLFEIKWVHVTIGKYIG